MEMLLGLPQNPLKAYGGETFCWEHCKHYLKDPVFFTEIVMWAVANRKRSHFSDEAA